MVNKTISRIILKNNSPLFDEKKYHPSNKLGVLLNDNVIKVRKGSALDDFINEREEIKEKIKKLNDKVTEKINAKVSDDDTKKQLEERLEKVDKLITGYEKGCLVNSTDEDSEAKIEGMSLLV